MTDAACPHRHSYIADDPVGERGVIRATILTALMMVAEIVTGLLSNSMALLADGWHMATHAGALAIAAFAYRFARSRAHDPSYSFGTGKVSALAGFGNAAALALISVLLAIESVPRLWSPAPIAFDEALVVAVIGLVVNLATMLLLRGGQGHDHHGPDNADQDHSHRHDHHAHRTENAAHDHNLRAAYLHVAADALVSILAITALLAAKYLGWLWLDPVMGLVGGFVIARWSVGLMRDCAHVLLDRQPAGLARKVRERIEQDAGSQVTDLHLWPVGGGRYAAIIALNAEGPAPPSVYKGRLADLIALVHVTVEVNRSPAGHKDAA